jgi:signal transduction histidine kinase
MARGSQDVVGFTRIFVLFCTLVLLPALLLSGFGVIAILNERQAEKQRRREQAEATLQRAEQTFVSLLDQGDRTLRAALDHGDDPELAVQHVRSEGAPVGAWVVLSTVGAVIAGEAPFTGPAREHLMTLASGVGTDRPAHVFLDEQGFTGVVSMQGLHDGRVVVIGLDERHLNDALRARLGTTPMQAVLRIEPMGDIPVTGALERLMAQLVAEKMAATRDAPEELVARRLAPPFDRYTLGITAPSGESTTRTTVVYLVLLVVFLATLITGVVVTARLIWQETKLSRLKTDFVSHMSHELRTPLTSIRMFIDTLKLGRAESPEEEQECLDLLAKETERLSDMIERVLGYARIKAGRRLFTPRTIAVADVVNDALDAFHAQNLNTSDLVLERDIEANLPPIHADRDALVEALLNLVGNAYKYTGPKKEIHVFARRRRGRVQLGVKDNGPGLPKAEHARIFERFYQSNALLSQKAPGSGLGLAITRAIIEGQGGRIFVESEPDKGATFTIELKPAA